MVGPPNGNENEQTKVGESGTMFPQAYEFKWGDQKVSDIKNIGEVGRYQRRITKGIPYERPKAASLTDKATDAILKTTQISPTTIITDFEKAQLNAISNIFPTATMHGCYFHFTQAIVRKLNELDMKNLYLTNPDYRQLIRMMMALSFCPVDKVILYFEQLGETLIDVYGNTEPHEKFIRYMRKRNQHCLIVPYGITEKLQSLLYHELPTVLNPGIKTSAPTSILLIQTFILS
ncbi:MULE transposase domain-containing protein [Ditylenchus destructor]|uniref:MULE transposase domain-containing protein n=1 Tax=Ditylenchus destructor TaxID=166010 RepID=A0AAD4MIE4_9BILA|nr:MULE transposase domain-containing protein [Ditylenchus destructor]